MRNSWRFVLILAVLVAVAASGMGTHGLAGAKPQPSASPTNPPTPYMPPDQATNGIWDVILQGTQISYSVMKLKDDGSNVTGVWLYDKRTVYAISGTRDGTHLTLTLTTQATPPATVGSIDATIDGIADMVGTITLAGVDTPFQGAQHARVPPPPVSTPGPQATETPY
ncbi:MAG TPA: hypothetical protein VEJ41_00145 [Candidatus Acidoferrales bacterium]|nr:hypothetical protein [Candidatus Acidoferrales bacterium]